MWMNPAIKRIQDAAGTDRPPRPAQAECGISRKAGYRENSVHDEGPPGIRRAKIPSYLAYFRRIELIS